MTKRTLIAAAALALMLGPAGGGEAQTNWLKTGKDLLQQMGRGDSTGSGGTGGGSGGGAAAGLSLDQIDSGLREALRVGVETVVKQLGATDGFNGDPKIHIPLPQNVRTVKKALDRVGMGGMLDDLETRLNRAAEAATPRAKELLWQAIREMSLEDAKAIYQGPDDAATQYFRRKMSPALKTEFRPVVDKTLSEAGAVQLYDQAIAQYKTLPFVPDVKADLNAHVLEKGLDGIFHYLAREEAAIRAQPVKRTTELLKTVFGH